MFIWSDVADAQCGIRLDEILAGNVLIGETTHLHHLNAPSYAIAEVALMCSSERGGR
jgi:hypothetical protein